MLTHTREKKENFDQCEMVGCSIFGVTICVQCGTKVCQRHNETTVRIVTADRLFNERDITGVSGHPCMTWRTEIFPLQVRTSQFATDVKNAETLSRKKSGRTIR